MHDNAWVYDLEIGDYDADLAYYRSLVRDRSATRVLDLGCGTGRILFDLARMVNERGGGRVVGLDLSEPMLASARARLSRESIFDQTSVSVLSGDMTNFRLDESFDLIIIGLNTFMYIYEIDDQISCLRAARSHLAKGGCLAIDVMTMPFHFLAESEHAPRPRLEVDLVNPQPDVSRFMRFALDRYDAAAQVDASTYLYEIYYADGRSERFTDDLKWHVFFPRELELLMRAAGLRVVERYGSYDREPFTRASGQFLWLMEADAG